MSPATKLLKMKKLSIVFFLLLMNISMMFAESPVKVGLSGTVQGKQIGIMVPVWVNSNVALVPAIQVQYAESVGSDVVLGLAMRQYGQIEEVAPYFGLRIGTAIFTPSSDSNIDSESRVDYIFGLALGVEYFFREHFSVGVEAQGNLSKSHKESFRFGNPDGLNFNTATMINVTVYF